MIGIRGLARTLMSGFVVFSALGTLKRSDELAAKAQRFTAPIESAAGGTLTAQDLVKVNAGVQVAAGGLFALGIWPRLMAIVLGVSLVPTTLLAHDFWATENDEERKAQQLQLLKSAGLVGGLVFAALDTGGRPSVFWSGRRAAAGLKDTVSSATHSVSQSIADTVDR